nr:diguanylate cyclase [bacterium]
MNMNVPFLWVQLIAVCGYILLLLAFLAVKKNKVIRSFIVLLTVYLLWTGGSLFMRMQLYPGYEFWYRLSIMSLFAITFFFYVFMCEITQTRGYLLKLFWGIGTVIIVVLTGLDVFLKVPVKEVVDGHIIFVYDMRWPVAIPSVFIFFELLSVLRMFIRAAKKNGISAPWIMPIFLGMAVQFVGNIVAIVPGNIFPYDILSGIINGMLLFYALYKRRLFKLTLLVSRGTLFGVALALSSVLLAMLASSLEQGLIRYFPFLGGQTIVVVAVLFVLVTALLFKVLQLLTDSLFVKEELVQAEQIKEFTTKISKSLSLSDISSELVNVVRGVLGVSKCYICLRDASGDYPTVYTANPLDRTDFRISRSTPMVRWFIENDGCIVLKDFKRTPMYKAMWESEKRQLEKLHIGCFVPLKCDNGLVGMLLLAEKNKNAAYTFDDITFLEAIRSVASIAINNANLYEKTLREAQTDHLTGLYNRKYFEEKLASAFEACRDDSLALVILNLDDFKLYNQLYGNREGDQALKNIARIILGCVGKQGIAARYSGKEFAIILPGMDTRRALEIAKGIGQQVAAMNHGADNETMKTITLSGGVCAYPYAAATVKQLMDNADMAVYKAKHSGKNKILVFTTDAVSTDGAKPDAESYGGRYAEYAPTIYALTAAIDAKDHYTFSHSQKVAEYATTLAAAAGMNEDYIHIIQESALLHDIGKISIPEHILSKPGRLTDEERAIMQTHVESSIAIIRHLPSLDYVVPSVVGHHERWDGRGYPRGIKGEDIPLSARCLAVADSFDAMTAERPYKKALPVEYALGEIEKNAGTQFDPNLATLFVRLVRSGKIHVGKPSV